MATFQNFAQDAISTNEMNNVLGGTRGNRSTQVGSFDANLISVLQQKHAGAASQSFVMVSKGVAYNVTLDEATHTMKIKNAQGGVFVTKY